MKVPPPSEQPVTEEEDQAFLTPTSRRKKRSLAARRAALRPWAMGIGLTALVAVAAVGAYTLAASIASWNDRPSTAATPTVRPAPMPSAIERTRHVGRLRDRPRRSPRAPRRVRRRHVHKAGAT